MADILLGALNIPFSARGGPPASQVGPLRYPTKSTIKPYKYKSSCLQWRIFCLVH